MSHCNQSTGSFWRAPLHSMHIKIVPKIIFHHNATTNDINNTFSIQAKIFKCENFQKKENDNTLLTM